MSSRERAGVGRWILAGVVVAGGIAALPARAAAQCVVSESGSMNCVYQWLSPDPTPTDPTLTIAVAAGAIMGIAIADHDEHSIDVTAVTASSPPIGPSGFLWTDDVDLVHDDLVATGQPIANTNFAPVAVQLGIVVQGAAVPIGQGVLQTVTADGTGAEGNGEIADPIDPVTGEFIIHHVDLEFPSFGVPFRIVQR